LPISSARTVLSYYFFFNDPPTTEIYTLSLHDALPILGFFMYVQDNNDVYSRQPGWAGAGGQRGSRLPANQSGVPFGTRQSVGAEDRKSTRLNSSHDQISYAVFCLKKKKKQPREEHTTQ